MKYFKGLPERPVKRGKYFDLPAKPVKQGKYFDLPAKPAPVGAYFHLPKQPAKATGGQISELARPTVIIGQFCEILDPEQPILWGNE
jgi:hypothetical protein